MGVSEDVVSEALSLSADKIEDIKVQNRKVKKARKNIE